MAISIPARPKRDARGTAALEPFPLPESPERGSLSGQGCRGLKALGRGSGKGHPGGRVQRGEVTPLVRGCRGLKPPALIGKNIASQRSGCGGEANILPY